MKNLKDFMMRKSTPARLARQALVTGALMTGFSGCATTPPYVIHGFAFHTVVEGQNALVLDYRYGKRGATGVGSVQNHPRPGHPISQHGQFGPMVRGEELYVKWEDRPSSQVYEQRVDLRGKLPVDLHHCEVTFQVLGDKIFVFVVTPQKRNPLEPPVGPPSVRHLKVIQVYP